MLEGYITPLLTSYLSRYIKNIKPSDLKLSFWGGDAVLTNLQLKLEAIEDSLRSLGIPFELKSGSVKQLTLHIPWMGIGSEPIIASFDSVECTIKLHNFYHSSSPCVSEKATPTKTTPTQPQPDPRETGVAPGYVSGLLTRIINNVKLRVTNLLLKVIEEHSDLQFSLSIKEVEFVTTNSSWEQEFIYTDHLGNEGYSLHRVCRVTGATVCLDVIGGCGQVEEYDEPFLDGCSFECRWRIGYRDNAVVENRFEVLARGLEFSVSQAQFVLFIHFLDWLMAVYYSMKRLKGRDDVIYERERERADAERKEANLTTTDSERKSPLEEEVKKETVPSLEGSEGGWGSWLMSFVAPEDDENSKRNSESVPSTPPSLSLGFYAESIKIDFRVSAVKKPHPSVFFSRVRKGSWCKVMSVQFSGCMSRVDRIPSLAHLGVSTGIMSVNGWIGGEGIEGCTCGLASIKKYKRTSGNEDKMIHVYSLGSISPVDVQPLLTLSLFDKSPPPSPPLHYWLEYKPEHRGFWFTYDYYNSSPERETETCQELLRLGNHSLTLSLGVLHRLQYFINKFRDSLEATPLVSQGMVVLGDPVAKTILNISSDTVLIHLPIKRHLPPSSHDFVDKSRDTKPLPAVTLVVGGAGAEITMAMYSGNATPTHPQQLLMECNIEEMRVCTGTMTKEGMGDEDQSILIPQLRLTVHNKTDGSLGNNFYYQFNVPEGKCDVTFSNLCIFFTVTTSWLLSSLSPPPTHNTNDGTGGDYRLLLLLRGATGEYSETLTKGTLLTASLGETFVHFVTSSETVPLVQSPAPVDSCLESLADNASHVTGHVTTGRVVPPVVDERVFEVRLVWPKEGGIPLFGLKIGGTGVYAPHFILNQFEEYATQLHDIWSSFKEETEDNKRVTSFIGMEEQTAGSPHGFPSHLDSPLSSSYLEEEEEEEEETSKTAHILSIIDSYRINISCEHILFMFPFGGFKTPPHATLTSCLFVPLSEEGQRLILFAFPRLKVETTCSLSTPHPLLANTDQTSLKLSLTDAVISTIINKRVSYLLDPLTVAVSLAPIQSPSVAGLMCIGVHVDINILQVTIEKEQVKLFCEVLLSLHSLLSSCSPPPPPLVSDTVFNRPLSSATSSHHVPHSLPPPPPFSDISSASLISLYGSNPSLWLQLTLGKLVVGVSDSRAPPTMYVVEADEISFSLDIQERIRNFQLKMSSLEGVSCSLPLKTPHSPSPSFTKLFSSSSSVVVATVAKEIEKQLGSVNGDQHVLSLPFFAHSPANLPSFLLLEVVSPVKEDSSHSSKVRLHVQTFEAVVWLPLVAAILDILVELNEIVQINNANQEEREDGLPPPPPTNTASNHWPSLDVKFNSFNIFIASVEERNLLLLTCEGLTVSSSLHYPVSRLVVNHSAMKRLDIAVSEKRAPPLPGYQLLAYSTQLIGIRQLEETSLRSCSLLYAGSIRILYSPSLSYYTKGQLPSSDNKLVLATGHLLELHFDSKVSLFCGNDQVKCLHDVYNDITQLIGNRIKGRDEQGKPVKQESETCLHYQILVTGKALILTLSSCEEDKGEEAFSLFIFNPTLMLTSIKQSFNVDLSLFNVLASYHGNDRETCHVIETCEGSVSEESGLGTDLVQIKLKKQTNEGAVLVCAVSHSVRLTLTPSVLLLLVTTINNFINEVLTERGGIMADTRREEEEKEKEVPPVSNNVLKSLSMSLATNQVIVAIGGSETVPDKDLSNGSGDAVKVSGDALGFCDSEAGSCVVTAKEKFVVAWESLDIALPPNEGESNQVSDGGPGNIENVRAQISVEGMELSVFRNGNKYDIMTYSLLSSTITYCIPLSVHDSGRLLVSLLSDWVEVAVGSVHVFLANKIFNSYFIVIEQLLLQQEKQSKKLVKMEGVDKSVKDEIKCYDDLRSNLNLITDHTDVLVLPGPGEVRFYDGGSDSPPAVMWRYKELRRVCRVSVLPVPFTVGGGEDWPLDVKLVCELSHYDDINDDWKCQAVLTLSQVSPSITLLTERRTEPSRMWRLALKGLEWIDDCCNIQRVDLCLPDIPAAVLSPLALAGCTLVDSVINGKDKGFNVSFDAHIKSLDLILRHDPLPDLRDTVYSGISGFPLDLFKMTSTGFNGRVLITDDTNQKYIELIGLTCLKYVDIKDLLWKEILSPTTLTLKSLTKPVKQSSTLRESKISLVTSTPSALRISPSLLYTVTMTTNLILRDGTSYTGKRNGAESCLIPDPYVLRNDTPINLFIGQVNTIDRVPLPGKTSHGYNWSSFTNDKKLHLSCMSESNIKWSNGFTIETEGVHQVVMDNGLCFLVHVASNGSIQKLVTISGALNITSRLCESLQLTLPSDSDLITDKFIDLDSQSVLEGLVWSGTRQSGLTFQFSKPAQCTSFESFEIPLEPNLSLIKVEKEGLGGDKDQVGRYYSFWSNVDSVTIGSAVQVTLAPLFEVINHFPFQLHLRLYSEERGEGDDAIMSITISGDSRTQPLVSSLESDKWYLLQFTGCSSLSSTLSSGVRVSTQLQNQLPEYENECLGLSLYKECKCTGNRLGEMDIVIIPTERGIIHSHSLLSKRKEGTIRIDLIPQVLLINGISNVIDIRRMSDGMNVSIPSNGMYPVSIEDELMLKVKAPGSSQSFTAELSFDNNQTPSDPPKSRRLTLTNSHEWVCKILLSSVVHNTALVTTLKPIFTLCNHTQYNLIVFPSLNHSTTSNDPVCTDKDRKGGREEGFLFISSNQSHPILNWYCSNDTDRDAHQTFAIYITADISDWSIPLSLSFVRRSFSLPTSEGAYPCLLTTHRDEGERCGHYYVIISHDPSPRLVCSNHTPFKLQMVEAGSKGIHSHPQTLLPGSETYFEPPSLAKLYPTTPTNTAGDNDNEERNNDVTFKTMSDIHIQLHIVSEEAITICPDGNNGEDKVILNESCSPSLTEWSDSVQLHYDTERLVMLSDTKILFSTSYRYGVLYVSLLPSDKATVPASLCSVAMGEKQHLLSVQCLIEQLTLSIDNDYSNGPVLTCTLDACSVKVSASQGEEYQCNVSVQSIQVDHHRSHDETIFYPVIGLPRYEHVPPLSIVERESPPFLTFSANWAHSDRTTFITEVSLSLQPVTLQFDDSFIRSLKRLISAYNYAPTPLSTPLSSSSSSNVTDNQCTVPNFILEEVKRDRHPLTVNQLRIEPVLIYLSLHFSHGLSLSVDDSRITLSPLSLGHLYFNWSELTQTIASHYTLSLLSQLDWIIGSLDVIGSPGTLMRTVQSGLKDFISLPYQGLTRGPGFFILGLGQGTKSLLSGIMGGALRSVTNFASGVALNVERLSFDEDHVTYQEDLRRRGQTSSENIGAGLMVGVSSFGMSVMSAAAGIVEQPLHSIIEREEEEEVMATRGYTMSLLTGVGKGLLGVVTKPVGGALHLVSQTGRGIISMTGLNSAPVRKETIICEVEKITLQPSLNRQLNILINVAADSVPRPLLIIHGLFKSVNQVYDSSLFSLSAHSLYVIDARHSILLQKFKITNYSCTLKEGTGMSDDSVILLDCVTQTCYNQQEFENAPTPLEQAETPSNQHSPPPNNQNVCTNASSSCNEVHINSLQVKTFLSLFRSTQTHSRRPQEYFKRW